MRFLLRVLLALAPATGAIFAQPSESQVGLILEQTAVHLRNASDFVCTELVDRTRWSSAESGRPDFEDALRLEVGWAAGKEIFGWSGARGFEERPAAEMLGDGAFSTGDFLSHARALFLSRQGEPRYAGKESLDGTDALRFDYVVEGLPTGYRVTTGSGSAEVPYHGSFWADPVSLEIRRLTVIADAIPAGVGIEKLETVIDYRLAPLRAGEALLPRAAVVSTRYATGAKLTNVARFEDCRAFETSASIHFEAPEAEVEVPSRGENVEAVAPGQRLFLRLRTPIEWGVSRVGDRLEAELQKEATTAAGATLEKGDRVFVRIRRLQRRRQPQPFFVVGLSLEGSLAELESIDASGVDVTLFQPGEMTGVRASHREMTVEGDGRFMGVGIGGFYVFGNSLRLGGLRMRWRTVQ